MSYISSIFGGSEKTKTKQNESTPALYDIDPQLAYMWEVSFRGVGSEGAENIKVFAQSTGIPAIMTESIKRRYMGKEYTYAGKDNSPKIFRVTFWDSQSLEVYHYFQKWKYIMNDPEGGLGVSPSNYMREISLKLLDTTGKNVVEEFVFSQCFPTEISEATLSYEVSAPMTFDVIFSFNHRSSGGK